MKKIFSLTLLAVVLFAASCSKDKNDNGGPGTKRLKSTTLDENWSFAYNNDGTLKEITGPSGFKETLTYETGKITVKTFWNDINTAKAEWTITNGKPVHVVRSYFDNMGQPSGGNFVDYEFNPKGLLGKVSYDYGGYDEYEYDSNDNLIRITSYNDQGIATFKSEYGYGTQVDRFPQYSVLRSDTEGFFFPPLSKHLPVSKKEIPLPANTVNFEMTYNYELDADGYVIKGTGTSLNPNYSGYSWVNAY
ncbi:MAG TPA: hypothetical protein VHM26_07610 [Chitinophagaceae bacterium]|jgi:hypothetical protein|nr:hypothetical protein [Chitinophagaceae bacterium]